MKQPHEYWYCFGKCTPYPKQIKKGMLPRIPYKRFNTQDECQFHIDNNKAFDPMEQAYINDKNEQ